MFVKIHHLKSKGVHHRYASLAETSRTAKGPRQRTVYYLRELNASPNPRRIHGVEVLDIFGRAREVRLIAEDLELADTAGAVRIRVGDISVLQARKFGNCYLAWHLWRSLRLDEVFPSELGVDTADVPWSRVIGLLSVYRLCVPASQRFTDPGVYSAVGLHDLLKVPLAKLDDKRLGRCLRLLAACGPKLFGHLKQHGGAGSAGSADVLLYRLRRATPGQGPLMVAVAMADSGRPVGYEAFPIPGDGPAEFDEVLGRIGERYRKARSICLFGKGELPPHQIASLKARGIGSVMVVPRARLADYGAELAGKDWVAAPCGSEWRISAGGGGSVYAMARRRNGAREDAAARRGIAQFEARLEEFDRSIAGRPDLAPDDIERSVRRILAAHPEVGELYGLELERAAGGYRLAWYPAEYQHRRRRLLEEHRVFHMDIGTGAPDALAERLRQMDGLERLFGSLGPDLAVLPRGGLDDRSKACLTLAFLGYVLFVSLEQLLKQKEIATTPEDALALLSDIRLLDIALPTVEGWQVILRRLTRLSDEQSRLLRALGLPEPQFSGGVYEERDPASRVHATGGRA